MHEFQRPQREYYKLAKSFRWQIAVRRTAKGIVLFPEKKRPEKTKTYVKILGGTLWLSGTAFVCFHFIGRRNSEQRTKDGHTTNNRPNDN
uniref:Uncharacterized protein n=1 Tax=Magallana gigas TaxID=29159 RepID=K1PHZ8_MAGGI